VNCKIPSKVFDYLVESIETNRQYHYVNEQEVCYTGCKIFFDSNGEFASMTFDDGTTLERGE
jgi:hypothetical protein